MLEYTIFKSAKYKHINQSSKQAYENKITLTVTTSFISREQRCSRMIYVCNKNCKFYSTQ